jgi:hypothetical protein
MEYLQKTESAARRLIESIAEYHDIVRSSPSPIFTGSFANDADRERAFERWAKRNEAEISQALEAERKYFAETLAKGSLCGALLQIAYMGIRLHGREGTVPNDLAHLLLKGSKVLHYLGGRRVRQLPIALIILAGRNQYHHMDEDLREPTLSIFRDLAKNHEYPNGEAYIDPAFDLSQGDPGRMPGNIVYVLGWGTYENYQKDMHTLLDPVGAVEAGGTPAAGL